MKFIAIHSICFFLDNLQFFFCITKNSSIISSVEFILTSLLIFIVPFSIHGGGGMRGGCREGHSHSDFKLNAMKIGYKVSPFH